MIGFRWEDGKIVEENHFSDSAAFNAELMAYQATLEQLKFKTRLIIQKKGFFFNPPYFLTTNEQRLKPIRYVFQKIGFRDPF